MERLDHKEDMMDLARRALAHCINQTTDTTESIMTMPIEAYTDETRYQAERNRIFSSLPIAGALSIELSRPGNYKTISILEKPLLLVRGNDGRARAFLNVCRHRGARICEAEEGVVKKFSCPYHSWVYDLQGNLISRYAANTFGELDHSSLGLTPIGCEEEAGVIWLTLDSSEPIDIKNWLGGMRPKLASLDLGNWHLFKKRELEGPGWKVTMDGYLEIYHHNTVHGRTVGQHTIGNLLVLDTHGPHQRLTLGRKSLKSLETLPEEDWEPLEHIRLVHNCFPNLSISGILGDHCLVSLVFPGPTADTTRTIQYTLASEVPETETELEAAENFSAMVLQAVQDEDYRLGLLIQDGIKAGANTQFLYGKNEPAVQNYHRWIDHFMRQEKDFSWDLAADQG